MCISQLVRAPVHAVTMNCFAEWTSNVVGVCIPPDNVRFREGFHRGKNTNKLWIIRRGGDSVKRFLEISGQETYMPDGICWPEGVEVLAGRGSKIRVEMQVACDISLNSEADSSGSRSRDSGADNPTARGYIAYEE